LSSPVDLIVGLGNPGPRYADTRHNAGFQALERLAAGRGGAFRSMARCHGEVGEISLEGHRVRLLKPGTFMNESGRAVAAMSRFYRIAPQAVLVFHDEIDLAPGTVRIKLGGGDGGHKGIRDIIACLGTQDFTRARIGVGHPGRRAEVLGHVLKPPQSREQALMDESITRLLDAVLVIVTGHASRAMNLLHRPATAAPDTA